MARRKESCRVLGRKRFEADEAAAVAACLHLGRREVWPMDERRRRVKIYQEESCYRVSRSGAAISCPVPKPPSCARHLLLGRLQTMQLKSRHTISSTKCLRGTRQSRLNNDLERSSLSESNTREEGNHVVISDAAIISRDLLLYDVASCL